MASRSFGEKVAISMVILVLILGGTVILSVPYGIKQAPTSTTNQSTSSSTTVTTNVGGTTSGPAASSASLSSFQTYAQLDKFITTNAKNMQQNQVSGYIVNGGVTTMVVGPGAVQGTMTIAAQTVTVGGETVVATSEATGSSGQSFTTTNNQVQGVDEVDIVKTDGTYLYVASSQTVSIIKAYPVKESSLVSSITLPDYKVIGMTLAPQRLAVLGQSETNSSVDLRLYDISTPSSPSLLNSIAVSGNFVGARMAQGYFYMILQQPSYLESNGNYTATYPTLREDGVSSVVSPDSTYYTPNSAQVSTYTMVLSMSMTTGSEESTAVLTGSSSTIYVSTSNIYVVNCNFYPGDSDGILGNQWNDGQTVTWGAQQNSTIFRVAYSAGNITVAAAGSVPGGVLNQYSMNEYDNYFMVATDRAAVDDVFVLNQGLGQVGALHNIAPGENIFAVRFEGDLGYVVTYEQVDPLFTISFANPAAPTILSALHINGFSDYLYPFGSGYLVGVGKDTVNASNGDFSYYLGLKISLFNVTTANSTVVENYIIGTRGTDSPVLENPLAFTFDSATNTMVVPVELYTNSTNVSSGCCGGAPQYGQFTWQGDYVFNVSDSGFKLLGTVTQNMPSQSPSTHETDRNVIIGNVLYTISQNEVMATSLSDFGTLATIPLSS